MSEGDLFKYDVRVRERMLRRGLIKEAEVQSRIEALPDRTGDCETINAAQPALGREDRARASRPPEVQAAPLTPPMARPVYEARQVEETTPEVEPEVAESPAVVAAPASEPAASEGPVTTPMPEPEPEPEPPATVEAAAMPEPAPPAAEAAPVEPPAAVDGDEPAKAGGDGVDDDAWGADS